MNPTGTEARVCADIAARQALGIKKYGTTVEDNKLPLLEWLRHAYLETLDKAVYLRRAIESIEGVPQKAVGTVPAEPKTLGLYDFDLHSASCTCDKCLSRTPCADPAPHLCNLCGLSLPCDCLRHGEGPDGGK